LLTLKDLVEFILRERRGIVFKDWTAEQLVPFLEECLDKKLLFYTTDGDGQLTGIVTLTKERPFRLYIAHALTTKPGEFGRVFFEKLFQFWPHIKYIETDRHGRRHEYIVRELKRKLHIE
jgi:hypothetical protein